MQKNYIITLLKVGLICDLVFKKPIDGTFIDFNNLEKSAPQNRDKFRNNKRMI